MNTDQMKKQAASLAGALRAMGIADISSARALDVLSRMNGKRNWQTAKAAGSIGDWNGVQVAVCRAYRSSDLLGLVEGQDFLTCGDSLFVAMMNVSLSQPLSRVIKTFEHWAAEVDKLLMQVQVLMQGGSDFCVDDLAFPKGLAPSFLHFLQVEMSKAEGCHGWDNAGSRLETTRRDLYTVACELRHVESGSTQEIMMLDSTEGAAYGIPLVVPRGMTREVARETALKVIQELQNRGQDELGSMFDFSAAELRVRLAQAGFVTVPEAFEGPTWD
jgi:hypothetical protein